MDSHYPFKAKRPRLQPGVEDPVPSSIPFTPPLDPNYTSLPYDIQQQLDQLALFYGVTSGYEIHQLLDQEHCYQQLPGAPPALPDPSTPYAAEKQPSMQIPPPEPYSDAILNIEQQPAFNYEQPELNGAPLANFPLMPDQTPLAAPLISDADQSQPHHLSTGDFYANQALKQEAQLEPQSMMPSQHLMAQNLPQMEYGTAPSLVNTTVLTQHTLTTTEDIPQYGIVPTAPLGGSPMQNGWSDVQLMDQQANFEILLPNQRGGKRGPFKDPNLREQTAQTRKIGSCIRCRMQRIRCENNPEEEGGPCLTCKKVSNSRAGRFPCLRYKITDIRLFKPGQVPGYEWTRRWNNNISDPIQNWASDERRTIFVSAGLSNKFVEVEVRKFIPQIGDKLERTWDYNGTKRSVSIPPYALVSLDDVKKAYLDHIRSSMEDAFGKLLGPRDGLLYKTYQRAWHIFRDRSTPADCLDLLHHTLMLWMSVRLTTRSSFIVGNETLGMHPNILDETSPNHGMIPLPPVLEDDVEKQAEHMAGDVPRNIHSPAQHGPYHSARRRVCEETRDEGANILLAHFHYCNKGIYPFSEECKDQDLRTLAGLDEEKIKFVHGTSTYAKRHQPEWEDLQKAAAYEHDYFFSAKEQPRDSGEDMGVDTGRESQGLAGLPKVALLTEAG
ncbi:hypothetical protein FALBO_9615 [Fusarium albosuccineum]|uniref:Zn(2)-C6 fungal-type domain-containing protein n=1 Tax=Fusarium albosuccineum TaxID=1237068 RepID=A0A8H4PIY1_9HYPO|nr:hypothetical protein FALBO_9615 [Fusarium albosuccineum]